MSNKTYVIRESAKNAKEFFKGRLVLQGIYNDKKAVYVSANYSDNEMDVPIEVYSASAGNKYLGIFEATQLVDMEEAVGIVLIAK